jgi:hypothetical protein
MATTEDWKTAYVLFVQDHLGGVTYRGEQCGYGLSPNLIMFEVAGCTNVMVVPVDVLYMRPEDARWLVQQKIKANLKAYSKGAAA